uniref:Uncharacterized protein n=1 Tax=Tetranychus urticae TaxID=32264 RepID=T1L143_TETUR
MYPVGVNFIDRGPDGRGQILMVNETKEGMIMMTTIILTIMKVMEPNPRKKTQKDIQ